MKRFARLCNELDEASQPREKVAALASYFLEAAPVDAAWGLQFLSGRKPTRAVTSSELRAWATEEINLPTWLFDECHEAVGDLAETIALLLPECNSMTSMPLHELVEHRMLPLQSASESVRKNLVWKTWRELSANERFVWNKLITGGFRVGVAEPLVARALAAMTGVELSIMAHRLDGDWEPTSAGFQQIVSAENVSRPETARTHPFFQASPIDGHPSALGDLADWQVEWKWSGIRAQLIRRHGGVLIWSRDAEWVTTAFAEIADAGRHLPNGTVLDGQIVAWQHGRSLPFGELQRRLERKGAGAKLRNEVPVMFVAYDLLETSGEDWRGRPLVERRRQLEAVVDRVLLGGHESNCSIQTAIGETPDLFRFAPEPAVAPALRLSELIACVSWSELAELRKESRKRQVDGLMFKRRSSGYGPGPQQGDWWTWKIDPLVINGVLISARVGSEGRSSLFTEYTFGVWHEGKLTTIARASSGAGDAEIAELDAFIRANTTGKFGPMRTVKPEIVFELAFESVKESTRHKSGLTLRNPRINRWRREKMAEEADSLETLRALLREGTRP